MNQRHQTSCHLIVEGKDDLHTVIHLTTKHGINREQQVVIKDAQDWKEALNSLPVMVKSIQRTGIIIDADIDVSSRWQAVCHRLEQVAKELKEAIDLPEKPYSKGTIIELGKRRVGVWLMPDNEQSGKLEDFLKNLVPAGDCCWQYAEHVTQEAYQKGAHFSELDMIKAHIYTWLAWQKEPGLPFGTAIKAAYFLHDTPEAQAFVSWFQRLFFA